MAQGLGALARGFIQGSNLGMQMKRDERQAEESSELMKLRQSAEVRAEAAEGREVSKEGRSASEHEQNLTLRELEAERLGSQEKRAVSQEGRAVSQEKRAVSQEGRLVKDLKIRESESTWQISKEKRAEEDKNLASIAGIEYQRVEGGGDFSPEFMEQAKGTRFDPIYMAKPEYSKAAKQAYDHVGDLMEKVNSEGANSIGLGDVNKPEFLHSLSVLMAPDIKRGIGDKDSFTGKTIVNKELATIIPYDNQGLVVDVEVFLDDGTSYIAPITEGRSRHQDDPVKIIPVGKFIENLEGYARMASAYNQPDLQNAVRRHVGTELKPNTSAEVTKRQYLSEVGDIDRDELKEIGKLSSAIMNPKEKEKAMQDLSNKYDEARNRVGNRYGVTTPKAVGKGISSVASASGGGEKRTDVEAWADGDAKKMAFIKSGEEYESESGESPFDAFTPSELERLYLDYNNIQEANSVADAMRSK